MRDVTVVLKYEIPAIRNSDFFNRKSHMHIQISLLSEFKSYFSNFVLSCLCTIFEVYGSNPINTGASFKCNVDSAYDNGDKTATSLYFQLWFLRKLFRPKNNIADFLTPWLYPPRL